MTPPTKQPAIDIVVVSGPELDALVAVEVMRQPPSKDYYIQDGGKVFIYPPYSTDANCVREVDAEIERRGLVDRYIHWLLEEVSPISKRRQRSYDLATIEAFAMAHATPEQRCRAALRAVMA